MKYSSDILSICKAYSVDMSYFLGVLWPTQWIHSRRDTTIEFHTRSTRFKHYSSDSDSERRREITGYRESGDQTRDEIMSGVQIVHDSTLRSGVPSSLSPLPHIPVFFLREDLPFPVPDLSFPLWYRIVFDLFVMNCLEKSIFISTVACLRTTWIR